MIIVIRMMIVMQMRCEVDEVYFFVLYTQMFAILCQKICLYPIHFNVIKILKCWDVNIECIVKKKGI